MKGVIFFTFLFFLFGEKKTRKKTNKQTKKENEWCNVFYGSDNERVKHTLFQNNIIMQKNIAHKTAPRNAMSFRRDKNPIRLQGCKQIGPEDCPDKMLTPHLQG